MIVLPDVSTFLVTVRIPDPHYTVDEIDGREDATDPALWVSVKEIKRKNPVSF